ncbi:MAG TPA: ATP-binding cassette domain-containing protein [Saprospiraceae bacterium]|nr:ATP-binding cassette domain-containing protein [Saprospiraceae bacterium]HMQ83495.1 ATP-binding cassette domain-containing protein [Saprospiraceae bacterium]
MLSINCRKNLHSTQGVLSLEVELTIPEGVIVGITGASGNGKTTLLRILAGLAPTEEGFIFWRDKCWLDTRKKIFVRPQDRQVGMVFQDYALFPNLSVKGNLKYALPKGHSTDIIEELLRVTEMEELASRYPSTLSGGQQQRVALARALVNQPQLLLLDEPFSALDPQLSRKLQDYLSHLSKNNGTTILLVSHDITEIQRLSHRTFELHDGKLHTHPIEKQTPPSSWQLQGMVTAITPSIQGWTAQIAIGENMLQLPIVSPLEIGSIVWIDFKGAAPTLRF